MSRTDRLRMVLATPLEEELCVLFEELEPRVELVRDHSLLPPMRHPGDHGGDPSWSRTPEQQARFEELVDSAEALYGIPDVSSAALARTVAANPRLRWVQTMAAGGASQVGAAGLAPQDLDRVTFTTSAGVHSGTLAEFALFGLLAGAKTLPRLLDQQRSRTWSGRWAMGQLHQQTVLVVGLGNIGRQTAQLLTAVGARVIGANRSAIEVEGVERVVGLDQIAEVAPEADAIVVTLPGAPATEGLVGERVLGALRRGATVVNVGRGTVIDEPALVRALQDGAVGFAALDVTEVEPLPAESPLWGLPNALISPHTAALNPLEDRRIAELTAENARRLLDGETLRNVVGPDDLA
ncbi:D-2-hydroxyacid dehydrogenase [Actinotalea sp. K2]|uniref:D-2-hydroxyacid dehydrogenase n=1 Tax=Actinotalea sp. K2 TaxID=2939438 RepID=UPI002017C9D8|nr:D-2-hydroxyacid dehydrogenase [Actinotalea sp. K2]MCL3859506.1 D-2-hydroxyacid dehydrogenase [Actinotalea sp. K2]